MVVGDRRSPLKGWAEPFDNGRVSPPSRSRARFAVATALACAVTASCGGSPDSNDAERSKLESDQALSEATRIGDALLATNAGDDERSGLFEREDPDSREGLVEGTPSSKEADELPPAVGLASRSAACQNASLAPSPGNLSQLEGPIRCLLNAERRARGLSSLGPDARLGRAAALHSRDMVSKRYFAHRSRSGRSPAARIRAAGWMTSSGSWVVGENLAWGSGSLATPAKIVDAWMGSSGHKANILRRGFRQVGVGVAYGTPSGSRQGATYSTSFGGRP